MRAFAPRARITGQRRPGPRVGARAPGPVAAREEHALLRLQRLIGNQAAQRLVSRAPAGYGQHLGALWLQAEPQDSAQERTLDAAETLITATSILEAVRELHTPAVGAPVAEEEGAQPPVQAKPRPGDAARQETPTTPRPGTMGDLMGAVVRIPAVEEAITRLRTEAELLVRRDWSRVSSGERSLVISHSVLIAGGALAGALAHDDSRRFLLDQIQGRTIPIPRVPLTFQFNLTGPDPHLVIGLNVGALLPEQLGFR